MSMIQSTLIPHYIKDGKNQEVYLRCASRSVVTETTTTTSDVILTSAGPQPAPSLSSISLSTACDVVTCSTVISSTPVITFTDSTVESELPTIPALVQSGGNILSTYHSLHVNNDIDNMRTDNTTEDKLSLDKDSGSQIIPDSCKLNSTQDDSVLPIFSFTSASFSVPNSSVTGGTDLIDLTMDTNGFSPASKSTCTSVATSNTHWSFANNSKQYLSAESCYVSAHHQIDSSISLAGSVHSSNTAVDRGSSSAQISITALSSINSNTNTLGVSRPVKRATLDSSMEESEHKIQNRGETSSKSPLQHNSREEPSSSDSAIFKALANINDSILQLGRETKSDINAVSLKLDSLVNRISNVEIENTALNDRLDAVEAQIREQSANSGQGSGASERSWVPTETVTKILLLGDSNSSGKIKFGAEKGTLGAHLPGESRFIPTFASLPDLSNREDGNFAQHYTDIIVAVGTNDLRGAGPEVEDCCPRELSSKLYQYVLRAIEVNPSIQIFLPAVVPTANRTINDKIDRYNKLLVDMARSNRNLTFISMGGLKGRDNVLSERFMTNDNTGLHLNGQGLRLYGSRLKSALRARHELPIVSRPVTRRRGNYRPRGGGRDAGDPGNRASQVRSETGQAAIGGERESGNPVNRGRGRAQRGLRGGRPAR